MSKDKEVIKELTETLDKVLEYASGMKMATRYCPAGSPNLLNATRLVNKVKQDYKLR